MQIAGHRFERRASTFDATAEAVEVDLSALAAGVTQSEDFIFYRDGAGVTVYDRICDHNGGRLISNAGVITCPLHGWRLDAATGCYANAAARKVPLLRAEGPLGVVPLERRRARRRLQGFARRGETRLRFLNHACVIVETAGLRIATDPWVKGPAFGNGWWLAFPSPEDSLAALNACDALFLSHNHPDHLHPETLAALRRDMPILTPDFATGSTRRYLRDLGFTDIRLMGFDEVYVWEGGEVALSCLKSGDFRDDAGLLVESGEFSALFGVDCNFIDFWRFPKGLTVFANSFAGGASGFPLCFETHDEDEKRRIVVRNRNAVLATNRTMLGLARPAWFLPYAGFFKEAAPRDAYVAERNGKNAIAAFEANCAEAGTGLLDVTREQLFRFEGATLVARAADPVPRWPVDDIAAYLEDTAVRYGAVNRQAVADYFAGSGFRRDLDFQLVLTDDAFSPLAEPVDVRFREGADPVIGAPRRAGMRFLQIRARAAEAMRVIAQGLPWEDLSIGFQCRIWREPNVYNADFWYHFSNVYVNDAVRTRTQDCAGCEVFAQRVY